MKINRVILINLFTILIINIMLNYDLFFSAFQATDPPPIITPEYEDLLKKYNYITKSPLNLNIEDPFIIPEAVSIDNSLFKMENNPYFTSLFNTLPAVKKEEAPVITLPKPIKVANHKGYKLFVTDMDRYEKETGDKMSELKRNTLASFARLESGFNSHAKNPVSTAAGYFLMIQRNRKDLGSTSEYLNNTNVLFKAASRLYDNIVKNNGAIINKGRKMGLSYFLIMYGFWFNPSSIISYINNNGKSDGFADKQGTTILKVLRRAASVS